MKNLFDQELLEKLNPLDNYVFYRVMGEQGDEVQLLGFLNAVLCSSGREQFRSVDIRKDRAFIKKIREGKTCILDLLATLEGGTKVNIEVQLRDQKNIGRRSVFYVTKAYGENLEVGRDYRELPDMVAINILGFDFPPGGAVHTSFHLREDSDPSLVLTDALEIHCINMVQWRRHRGKDVKNDPLHRWLVLLDEKSAAEEVEEAAGMDIAVMAAKAKMELVRHDKRAYRAFWVRKKEELDINSWISTAEDRGIEWGRVEGIEQGRVEGIEQGKVEGMAEVARKMKARGDSLIAIAEVTGLPPEEIDCL